jgi:hypothetical protein
VSRRRPDQVITYRIELGDKERAYIDNYQTERIVSRVLDSADNLVDASSRIIASLGWEEYLLILGAAAAAGIAAGIWSESSVVARTMIWPWRVEQGEVGRTDDPGPGTSGPGRGGGPTVEWLAQEIARLEDEGKTDQAEEMRELLKAKEAGRA